ncbi:uncharacterized protein LOC6737890 isoform X1 [Drosophila simulans]|uniref:GD12686 n=2 Tax=Drosophila simulans TaxID=7240 RepID=B4QRT9_DROSI|nr:uncharacterized protein LOC6737890 isoform X1 [Drosophila simulans]XP_016031672.2 uncharacterized protein LOC6737890 isoform X1 [Drosophila simulans]EDX10303.1 GD12686 [Drosophila simulans]KMY99334.1 uncharacterized protein Dsimw501_GD12686, isoform A [Drosophila simulans]
MEKKDGLMKDFTFQFKFMPDSLKRQFTYKSLRNTVFYEKIPLQKKLKLALERNIGPHAYIIVNDTVYKCQVFVLRIYCTLFTNNLKRGDVVKFPRDAISNECFEWAYAWMTSNEIRLPRENILHFLVAAQYLQCNPLIKRILEFLNDHRTNCELFSFSCYLKARDMGMAHISDMIFPRVSKSFLVLVSNGDFIDMDIDVACTLLRSRLLAVQNEIEIFYSALLWLISNYEMRVKYIPRVLGFVKFHMIPSVFLLQWTSNLKDLQPELAINLFRFIQNAMLGQFEYYTETFQSKSMIRGYRRWTLDPKCPYLSHFHANGDFDLSLNVFFRYLRQIQNAPNRFIARLIMKENMEDNIADAMTITEPSTSKNSEEDLEEPSYLDVNYYSGTTISTSSTRISAGEYNCSVESTSSTEDLDAALNVKAKIESDLSRERTFYRSAVDSLYLLYKNYSFIDSDLDSSESSTTTSIDSLTDSKNGSVYVTIVNFPAEYPADSNARYFSDSTSCSACDSERESVHDSNVSSTPNLTPESCTEYSGTASSVYSTESKSSEVNETENF